MYESTEAAGLAGRGPSAPQIPPTGGLGAGGGNSIGLGTPCCPRGEIEGLEREGLTLTLLAIGESSLLPETEGSSLTCSGAREVVEAEAACGPEEDEAEAAWGLEEAASESFDLFEGR